MLEKSRTIQHSVKAIASSTTHTAVQKMNGEVVCYENNAEAAQLEPSKGFLALKSGGSCVAIGSKDNKPIVLCDSADGAIKVYRHSDQTTVKLGAHRGVTCLSLSSSCNYAASLATDGIIKIYSINSGK